MVPPAVMPMVMVMVVAIVPVMAVTGTPPTGTRRQGPRSHAVGQPVAAIIKAGASRQCGRAVGATTEAGQAAGSAWPIPNAWPIPGTPR
jgi:hypothetical protein